MIFDALINLTGTTQEGTIPATGIASTPSIGQTNENFSALLTQTTDSALVPFAARQVGQELPAAEVTPAAAPSVDLLDVAVTPEQKALQQTMLQLLTTESRERNLSAAAGNRTDAAAKAPAVGDELVAMAMPTGASMAATAGAVEAKDLAQTTGESAASLSFATATAAKSQTTPSPANSSRPAQLESGAATMRDGATTSSPAPKLPQGPVADQALTQRSASAKQDKEVLVPADTNTNPNKVAQPTKRLPKSEYSPALLVMTGQLSQLEPSKIPDVITRNRFIGDAMTSASVGEFLATPKSAGEIARALDISPDKLSAFGVAPENLMAPKQLLNNLGIDAGKVTKELESLKAALQSEGLSKYLVKSAALQPKNFADGKQLAADWPAMTAKSTNVEPDSKWDNATWRADQPMVGMPTGIPTGIQAAPTPGPALGADTAPVKAPLASSGKEIRSSRDLDLLSEELPADVKFSAAPEMQTFGREVAFTKANLQEPGAKEFGRIEATDLSGPSEALRIEEAAVEEGTVAVASPSRDKGESSRLPDGKSDAWQPAASATTDSKLATKPALSDSLRSRLGEALMHRKLVKESQPVEQAPAASRADSLSSARVEHHSMPPREIGFADERRVDDQSNNSTKVVVPAQTAPTAMDMGNFSSDSGESEDKKSPVIDKPESLGSAKDKDSMRIELGDSAFGPLDMAVAVDNDVVDVKVIAGDDAARDALLADANKLRDQLDHQNIRLKSFDVGVGSFGAGLAGNQNFTNSGRGEIETPSAPQIKRAIGAAAPIQRSYAPRALHAGQISVMV